MSCSASDQHHQSLRDSGLTPYAEMATWRRRFYLALGAAMCALLVLALICATRL